MKPYPEASVKKRTVISLILNIAVAVLAVIGLYEMMTGTVSNGEELLRLPGVQAFKYYTVDSNLLTGLSSLVTAVFLVSVLAGKRTALPKWAEAFRLMSVTSVTLTALVVAFYLAPEAKNGFGSLYEGPNFIFHCVIPILAIAGLLLQSSEQGLRFRANLLSLVPVAVYGLYYIIPYMAAGPDKTGHDWYGFLKNNPSDSAVVLSLLVLLITLALSVLFWCVTRNFDRVSVLASKRREEKKTEGYESVTAQEFYQTRVIKLICAIAPAVALCAAVIFTTLTLTDRFEMSALSLIFFDACCLAYLPVALYISDTAIGSDGIVIASKARFTKRLLTLLITLQWNLISYLAPFKEFWAYAFLFAAVAALFLDKEMLLANELLIFFSMLLSWLIRGDVLLPARSDTFATDVILRISAVAISFIILYVLVLLIDRILLTSLDRISDYDPLTHTLTRRKLQRAVEEALATYNRIWVPCCIAIFDIDDFKQINDTYGHITGDEVLKEFARILYANVQSRDVIFRYGGEEFLILFFCSSNFAEAACERILHEFRNYRFSFLPAGEHITCTAGISVSARNMTAEEFIELADKRLYIGKNSGKDRVVTQ